MPRETTPKIITETINHLCCTIQPSEKPFFVQVYPLNGMRINECFPNVSSVVSAMGGKAINGWTIWQWANILVEAEAHAIWESPDGKLVDITPHINQEKQILFLPDDNLHYTGKPIPSRRSALTASPLVTELIVLLNQRDRIAATSEGNTYSIPSSIYSRIFELQNLFRQKVGVNSLCPCGSGLKYKKCCGRYE